MAPMYNILYNTIMDLGCKNSNDLISKDAKISASAASAIINLKDTCAFAKLCEKSEFIFDFLKEKITKNLCNAVTKENFLNIFEFTKIYNADFENFIVNSWLKFADEDLTDEILTLFEDGTKEQMAYAAAYFYHINDPLALEYLEKYAFCDYDPLAQNCALALSKFDDKKLYSEAIRIIQDKNTDDFEKYKYVNFLVSYGDKSALDALLNYLENTYSACFAASGILYLTGFDELTRDGKPDKALEIFDTILSGYPEEISLETVLDFGILNFIKYLVSTLNTGENTACKTTENNNISPSYIKRIILKAKYKFNIISREDIYTFDLSKNAKKEIISISEYINSLNLNFFDGLENEFGAPDKGRILEVFDVILNFGKTGFSEKIAQTILNTEFEDVISEGIKVLKTFGRLSLVEKECILNKIKNENLKTLTESYFG